MLARKSQKVIIEAAANKIRDQRGHRPALWQHSVIATANLSENACCLFTKFKGVISKHANNAADMDRGKEILDIEVDDSETACVKACIRHDTSSGHKAVDARLWNELTLKQVIRLAL